MSDWASPDGTVSLLEGDCLARMAELPDASVDAVVTDPPYNVGKDFGNGAAADRRQDYAYWLDSVWRECGRVAKEGSFLLYTNRIRFIPVGMQPPDPWRLFHVAVWHKRLSLAGTWYRIAPHWEPIFILLKGPRPWCPFRNREVFSDVFEANVQMNRRGHPTEKPLDLIRRLLEFACPTGGVVLDPFFGSGTTAVAAWESGRTFIGIDISVKYLQMARGRVERALLEREHGEEGADAVEAGQTVMPLDIPSHHGEMP